MKLTISTNFDVIATIEHENISILHEAINYSNVDLDITLYCTESNDAYGFRVTPEMRLTGHCHCKRLKENKIRIASSLVFQYKGSLPRFVTKGVRENSCNAYFTGLGVGRYGFINEEKFDTFPVNGEIKLER